MPTSTITSSGPFSLSGKTVTALTVVGDGGGGGGGSADLGHGEAPGGGGGGGESRVLTQAEFATLFGASTSLTITIGTGGAGGADADSDGTSGSGTSVAGNVTGTAQASGGNGGALGGNGVGTGGVGGTGGAEGTGFNGGNGGTQDATHGGGGGGGAYNAAGGNGAAPNGGAAGTGGTGTGGSGDTSLVEAQPGSNYGGGGGGGGSFSAAGGAGAQGVVVIVYTVAATGPEFDSAEIPAAGTTVVIQTTAGAGGPLLPSSGITGFTVESNRGYVGVASAARTASTEVTLTLSRTIVAGETITVSYAQADGNLTDSSSNELAAFTDSAVTNSSAQAMPTFATAGRSRRLGRIAKLVMEQDCRCLMIGDSLSVQATTPRNLLGILGSWDVAWKGLYCPPKTSAPAEGVQTFFEPSSASPEPPNNFEEGTADETPNDTALPIGEILFASNLANGAAFHKSVWNFDTATWLNGAWGQTETIRFRLINRKPATKQMLNNCALVVARDTFDGTFPVVDFQATAGAGTTAIEWNTTDNPGHTPTDYNIIYSAGGSSENETGKALYFNGHTVYSTRVTPGFMYGTVAYGGWPTSYHLDRYTAAQAQKTCEMIFPSPPNLIMTFLGTNLSTGEDETPDGLFTFYNNTKALVQKWIEAVVAAGGSTPEVCLINPFETNVITNHHAWMIGRGDVLQQIADELGCSACNLGLIVHQDDGSFASWKGTYLAVDEIHQKDAAGATHFMQTIWDEMVVATTSSGRSECGRLAIGLGIGL